MFEKLRNRCGPRRLAVAIVLGLSPLGSQAQQPVYPTYGVHNPPADSNCANPDCVYVRQPGEPTDPHLPPFWSSNWNMYRVFQGYEENPPPYDGAPPPRSNPGWITKCPAGQPTTTVHGPV